MDAYFLGVYFKSIDLIHICAEHAKQCAGSGLSMPGETAMHLSSKCPSRAHYWASQLLFPMLPIVRKQIEIWSNQKIDIDSMIKRTVPAVIVVQTFHDIKTTDLTAMVLDENFVNDLTTGYNAGPVNLIK